MRRPFGIVMGIALGTAVALGPATEPAVAVETTIGSSEVKLNQLVNEARAAAGLGALTLRDRLSRRAERHSRRMIDQGVLFHSDLGGIGGAAAEVVGYGASLSEVFTRLMASGAHGDILLGAGWHATGIGVARGAGRVWVTQIVKG